MGKTSCYQEKKKKTKVRKLINRAKNGLQRVRKFCRQHVMPVMLSTAIIGGVIFGTYLRATATGVEELYYTYWDLVSSIFAAEGYDMSIKNGNDKISTPDRVTGRQLWNNIKTWVKLKTQDAKEVFDEFVALPKFVTAEGITMSKELYELLGDFCAEYSSFSGTCDYGDYSATAEYIHSIMGITGDYKWTGGTTDEYNIWIGLKNGETLNLIQYGSEKCMFTMDASYVDLKLDTTQWGYGVWYSYDGSRYQSSSAAGFSANSALKQTSSQILSSISEKPVWIIKQGVFYPDVIDKVKDAVDLKNAPDHPSAPGKNWDWSDDNTATFPWWYYPNWLEDSMRRQGVTDEKMPDGDPDDGDDNKDKNGKSWKDILPALIPWVPTVVNPTETEKDSEKGTEKDTESDSKKNPMINPDTGRYIDPDTGYDIDPDTGKLIDPDTGELIEPDIPSTAGKAGNWKRLFPFCIPWDMMELIKSMQADKKAPVFEFKYTFKAVNYTWVVKVDMADYWKYIKIFRWGMTIFFIIGLFFLTVKFTTFVQRMGG
jgi:hypothetical protein